MQAEEFSSPCLAKAYALLLRRMEQGEETSSAHCLGALEPEEGELLAKIVANAVPAADPQRALRDYISVIKTEHLKQKNKDVGENDRDELLALAQRRLQQESRTWRNVRMAESTNKKTGDNQKKTDDMQSKQQIIKGLLETAKKNGKIASKELNLAIDELELDNETAG